jgi:Aerobic-type carbon monoxide dehydrogenase, middle subunit CoxM/CutM homologs
MKAFEFVNAQSLESAPQLAGRDGKYLAGGIDLLGEMKDYIVSPSRVVNVKTIPGLDQLATGEGMLSVGANVTLARLAANEAVIQGWPALAEAASEVGSPQIRAVATVGGNLAQHSRCWYYRQRDLTCLKRGGNMCYGREGQNKYLSIFTGNPCISPAVSNLAVALAALDARVEVKRQGKNQTLTISELYEEAWNNPLRHNSLAPGDLITRITVPPAAGKSTYLQMSEKSDFDWALVSCAVAGNVGDGKISGVRIVLGSVAPVPLVCDEAAAALEGRPLDDKTASAAANLALAKATPFAHNGYKVPIARALIRRALMKLTA